jgi:hypothetical protein
MDLIAADPVMTASDLGGWMEDLDGKPVEVLSETNGAVGESRVEPWWCEEVQMPEPEYLEYRCCMCPKGFDNRAMICPSSMHKPMTACRFVVVYIDDRGWKYRVMGGIGEPETFKARYNKPGTCKWRGLHGVGWHQSFDDAQRDLNVLAKKKGWAVYEEVERGSQTGS